MAEISPPTLNKAKIRPPCSTSLEPPGGSSSRVANLTNCGMTTKTLGPTDLLSRTTHSCSIPIYHIRRGTGYAEIRVRLLRGAPLDFCVHLVPTEERGNELRPVYLVLC